MLKHMSLFFILGIGCAGQVQMASGVTPQAPMIPPRNSLGGFDVWPQQGTIACALTAQDANHASTIVSYSVRAGQISRLSASSVKIANDDNFYIGEMEYPLDTQEHMAEAYFALVNVSGARGEIWQSSLNIKSLEMVVVTADDNSGDGAWVSSSCDFTP